MNTLRPLDFKTGLLAVVLSFWTFWVLPLSADDFSDVQFVSTPLTASITLLEGAGGNITASIGPDGVLLVDDDFKEMSDKLTAKLKDLGGATPRWIVNTHFHYDHTGGNESYGPTATIIASKEVRERLMTEQTLWNQVHPAEPHLALPTVTFEKSLTLEVNGDTAQVMHLPHGHTDGDSVVLFNHGKVIAMGDLFFSGMYPIFHPEHEGSLQGYIHDLKWVLNQAPADAKIVPGHGPLSTRADLNRFYEMILASVAKVKLAIHAGKTLDQIKKEGLDPKWESFSHGYRTTDQWLTAIYQNLKSN